MLDRKARLRRQAYDARSEVRTRRRLGKSFIYLHPDKQPPRWGA